MKISTKVRYGMRLMFQLAVHHGRGYVFLKDIARLEGISEKYLSQIVIPLRASGLVISSRGSKGGYMLATEPAQVTAKHVVQALDADFTAARRMKNTDARDYYPGSVTKIVWETLFQKIDDALNAITLQQLLDAHVANAANEIEYHI